MTVFAQIEAVSGSTNETLASKSQPCLHRLFLSQPITLLENATYAHQLWLNGSLVIIRGRCSFVGIIYEMDGVGDLTFGMARVGLMKTENRPAQNRSFTNEFLQEEAGRNKCSTGSTRLELARAKNRRDRELQNMRKCKERVCKMMERMREHEEAYHAAKDDVNRLKSLVDEEEDSP